MKKVTRKHHEAFKWAGLNSNHWLIRKQTDEELTIRHKEVGREKKIPS